MADVNKERVVRTGEVIQLRDSSDEANYRHTVGLINDFSNARPELVDVQIADAGGEEVEIIKIGEDRPMDVSNIDNLALPKFAHRLHAKRVNAKKNKLPKAA